MSSAFALELGQSLKLILDKDQPPQCRFCQCTELTPCGIAFVEDLDGTFRLARSDDEVSLLLPCAWYIDRVCNAPGCIQKLIDESREPAALLFDASGTRLP